MSLRTLSRLRCFTPTLLRNLPACVVVPARTGLTVWEPDKRSGYKPLDYKEEKWWQLYTKENLIAAYRDLVKQFRMFARDVRLHWQSDAIEYIDHGDVRMVFDFRDPDPEKLEGWIVTADSDYSHGRSKGEWSLTPAHTCLFTGSVDRKPLASGFAKAAGYVNMRSPFKMKAFWRPVKHDWMQFTHLVIRLRGDGRTYMFNINTRGDFDVSWNDMYCHPLYTHGGPYWQVERIPFSKFFFSHKGRIQDDQDPIDLANIDNVSITCMDGIDGPFSLEIDYIAVEFDEFHKEEFAYEMYQGRMFET